ncbi:MAG: adenylosuccinate synthase [Phycisphaerales bacterium]|nr:adenylosuccinate synthase [Phycisphaerales bacterium]
MASRGPNGHTCVVGLGWGDEGKGKIVDLLCPDYDVVVRFNGGANAGHTVCVDGEKYALHLLPTGTLHTHIQSVIGPGVVVDPIALVTEIDAMAARGLSVEGRLHISDRAHLVMPYHQLEDRLGESAAPADEQIGTTVRGIGPCYADKMRRTAGLRVCDLFDAARFRERVAEIVRYKSAVFKAAYDYRDELDAGAIAADVLAAADRLQPLLRDATQFLQDQMADGRRLLFEGANGAMLDIDHGTYPYVTSSTTTAAGVASGAGVPPGSARHVLGVVKAYSTRVGRGPFVTELNSETGDAIRKAGNEYGTTTGRPRRCGWFDAVATRYAVRLGGVTELAVMHLDTLTGFRTIGVCTGYRVDGRTVTTIPPDCDALARAEPVIEFADGWDSNPAGATTVDELPDPARRYLARVEELVGVPVTIVSVGPQRHQTLFGRTQVCDRGRSVAAPA